MRTGVRNWTMAARRTVAGHCTDTGTVAPVGPVLWRSHTIETNESGRDEDWVADYSLRWAETQTKTLTMNNFILTKLLF